MDAISFLFVPETNKFKSIWLEFTKMVSGANLNWGGRRLNILESKEVKFKNTTNWENKKFLVFWAAGWKS